MKNGANYLNINVVTVTKRKSVKRKEKRDMKKKNDALDMENKRLQEQKAEAEQELKRAKKEVQTEKLKGAANSSDQHSRKRGFYFRKWKEEIVGTQERGFARPHT